jgi:putative transposase
VTVKYDPDHVLTLFAYSQSEEEREEKFIGYAHARNMDTQDLSLDELEQINKTRSKAKREHSNYEALLAATKRKDLVQKRKQEKKERQRTEQRNLRAKSKQNSKVVEMRKQKANRSAQKDTPLELLPQRISQEQSKTEKPAIFPNVSESKISEKQQKERHKLIISKNRALKRSW